MCHHCVHYYIFMFLVNFFILVAAIVEESNTSDLLKLLSQPAYDVDMRPTDNLTIVTITPNTFILLSMDQQQETIQFSQEFLFTWFDPIMNWNRSAVAYDRDWIKIPASRVWLPDVVFTNAIKISDLLSKDDQMVDLRYTGEIRTSLPSVVSSPCPLKIENFPYDVQECDVTIGPWNFDRSQEVVNTSVEFVLPIPGRFEGNSEWELMSIKSSRSDNFDSTLNVMFSEMTYTVTLKRKPVYYVLVIQAPTFLLCTVAIFGIFTPSRNDEERLSKVELSLNMFAAISLMLNLVSDMMPKASRLPLLGNYIIAEVFVVAAATLVSIAIQVLHHQVHTNASKPPKWLRNIVLFEYCRRRRNDTVSQSNTARSVQVPDVPDDMSQFTLLKESIIQTAIFVRTAIVRLQTEGLHQLLWQIILDRIDFLFLILFQIANIIVTAVFWR